MQNSYAYWRASHPLVFITLHLITGIAIIQWLAPYISSRSQLIALSILCTSNAFLLFISSKSKMNGKLSICIIFILISWGAAIKMAAQEHALFSVRNSGQIITICRNWMIEKMNKTIVNKEANGFALAILLGVKMDMNRSLINAYMQLGIIHVIAISGMHLEILFKNLKRITHYLPRKSIFIFLEMIVLLCIVWTYTLMAFASPSIVRATVFFSIYTIGNFIGAKTYMLNTIAAGLFILMLFNVNDLSNLGLQLSYAAVIGIHLFYKLIYKSIELNNPIIQFLWSNCCISLAAQITTFPILAFHFHQIAGWVLVSNFIMVPLSNLLLYGLGIVLILPSQFIITIGWGKMVEKSILFFNHFVQDWALHTQAQTIQITMNGPKILLYYLILLFVYLWLYLKQAKWFIAILSLICLYIILKLFSWA